jgi:CheY-like chemotaxis protein
MHRILLIEDEELLREGLKQILEEDGCRVAATADGAAAMELLRNGNFSPCMILLDLMMPVLDGWGFRAQQQQDPSLASIPVVVVSADGGVPQKAAALGASAYLQKPVDIDQLLATVRRYC